MQERPHRQGRDRDRVQHRHRPADGEDARGRGRARRHGVPIERAREGGESRGRRRRRDRGGHDVRPVRRGQHRRVRGGVPQEAQDPGRPRQQRGAEHHGRVQGPDDDEARVRDLHGDELLRPLHAHGAPHAGAVVALSSVTTWFASNKYHFFVKGASKTKGNYAASKLACLAATMEAQRRLDSRTRTTTCGSSPRTRGSSRPTCGGTITSSSAPSRARWR
ncbi:LOW QUALITY PROTEIN: uncharacterized protein MICPUCDRAFT_63405 [Micromonas pusilla CCMP1545]|uniref:Predicted protein n=1 Tax=Micromonas pusilla (strain CCMP1545) TaxID=564608 RepID=C1MZH8_MICPC|nr:LOW QUALITY PROTEIN: uncharacterized protein MICPUCDRAFT_63405 [Micromonas pusilla CCMP1545]EEH54872.1 predicted protein [Micromonas pusilla CCMP1545]|eukprot:XP_003061222.1 predicted protein [Micromonas pusilla CCMP1545]